MTRSVSKWLCAAALLPALWGCPEKNELKDAGVVDAGPAQVSEKEPNDRPEQAQPLTGNSFVVAALSADPSKPDEDWYALSTSTPQQVDVAVSAIQGTDVVLAIFDADKNPVVTVDSEREGKGERIPNLTVTSKAFVRVTGAKKGSGGAYTMTVLFSPLIDGVEREPNNRAVDATPLALGVTAKGFLSHAADEDWYRIELPAPPGSEPAPGTTSEDGGAAAPGSPTAPGSTPPGAPQQGATAPGATPNEGAQGAAPTGAPQGTPGAGAAPTGEPGGAPSSEQQAATGDTNANGQPAASGTTGATPEGQPPAMQPELPSSALRIEVSAVKGAKLEVMLLSAAEAPLIDVKGKDDEGLSLRNVGVRASDRVVYLVVKSAWSGTGKDQKRGYNADEPYSVTVSVEPAGANAEYEPNDDIAHATELPRDGFREGFLAPKTDQDFYVLKTDVPVLAHFEVSGVNRVDLALEVVRQKEDGGMETVLRANDGEIKEPEILNNVLCTDACYLKVEGASKKVDGKWVRDYENPDEPYRLSVSVVPDTGAEEREPNNDATNATPIAMAHPIRGTIQPRKDVDYYRLDLSARPVRTPIKATLLGILKVDLGLYLHRVNEDGTLSLVQTSDRAKGDQPETIRYSAEPGVYVLEVRDSTKKNEANFQDRYQLSVQEGD